MLKRPCLAIWPGAARLGKRGEGKSSHSAINCKHHLPVTGGSRQENFPTSMHCQWWCNTKGCTAATSQFCEVSESSSGLYPLS
ncbi:unnamed protein product [Caretta caretta]